jgi:hypothetical protein
MATTGLPLTVPDVVCMLDVDAFARETTSDLQSLTQDVFHRLLETPGSNPDDPTLGIGVEEMLSGTSPNLAQITRKVDEQLALDPRIDSISSTLTSTTDGNGPASYTLAIAIQVNGSVTSLTFLYTAAGGLVPL